MIDQLFQRENYVIAKKMLDVAHSKHQAIAGNLANIETPGYKRQDIRTNFAQELQKLAKADDLKGIGKIRATFETDLQSPSVRPDGNNVQIDKEMMNLAQNSLEYDFLTHYASNSMKRLKTAITGRVS